MKKILLGLSLLSSMSVFATDLDDAQKKIIQLQDDKIELVEMINTTYESKGLCYRSSYGCASKQAELNSDLAVMTTKEVNITSHCEKFVPVDGDMCEGKPFLLKILIKISPKY
jgi:hypothetical protein